MKIEFYICRECGFHGTADQFDRHVLSEGYNYGHNNTEPEEVELQCPECGLFEEDGIVEAEYCDYCDDYAPADDVTKIEDCHICTKCRVARNIIKGGK
jgi:hypothetical protein